MLGTETITEQKLEGPRMRLSVIPERAGFYFPPSGFVNGGAEEHWAWQPLTWMPQDGHRAFCLHPSVAYREEKNQYDIRDYASDEQSKNGLINT